MSEFFLKTDQDGILYIEFSTDGVNWDISQIFNVYGGVNEVHTLVKGNQYCRTRFTNTSSFNQNYFRLQTEFGIFRATNSPLNSQVQQDADSIVARIIDSEIDIAAGKYSGFSIVNKAGFNPDIDTTTVPEDVFELGGIYPGFPLTSGETLTVFSDSLNDTAAGSGLRTIRVTGLDPFFNPQSEDFTMQGLTPVTGTKIFVRAHTATQITTGGSPLNSNSNVGTITVRHTTTTGNVFLAMRPGVGQTNCAAYTIPAGYTGYLRKKTCKIGSVSGTTAACDYSIWTQPADKSAASRLRRPDSSYYGDGVPDKIYGGISFAEKMDIMLRVTSVASNNTQVYGMYDIVLVKN